MTYRILSGKLKQSVFYFQVKYKKMYFIILSHSYCVSNHRDKNKLCLNKHNLINQNITLYTYVSSKYKFEIFIYIIKNAFLTIRLMINYCN
jgi:hypothetical protein